MTTKRSTHDDKARNFFEFQESPFPDPNFTHLVRRVEVRREEYSRCIYHIAIPEAADTGDVPTVISVIILVVRRTTTPQHTHSVNIAACTRIRQYPSPTWLLEGRNSVFGSQKIHSNSTYLCCLSIANLTFRRRLS